MTDTELLDELIHTASQLAVFDVPEKQIELARAIDGFWRGLILSVGNRRSLPRIPDDYSRAIELLKQVSLYSWRTNKDNYVRMGYSIQQQIDEFLRTRPR